ncbi:MAG: hypothetical protein AVDCRST_MAG45-163, partial [uncultured Solirubrobacterales bacterium]
EALRLLGNVPRAVAADRTFVAPRCPPLQEGPRRAEGGRPLTGGGEGLRLGAAARRHTRAQGGQAADRRELCSGTRSRRWRGHQGLEEHRGVGARQPGRRRL